MTITGIAGLRKWTNPVDMVALNPQPLPLRGKRFTNPGDWVILNPQPLPPRATRFVNPGDRVVLNPQPLPPREYIRAAKQAGIYLPFNPDTVTPNPQTLAPRALWPVANSLGFMQYINHNGIIIIGGNPALNPQSLPPRSSELLNFQVTLGSIIRG